MPVAQQSPSRSSAVAGERLASARRSTPSTPTSSPSCPPTASSGYCARRGRRERRARPRCATAAGAPDAGSGALHPLAARPLEGRPSWPLLVLRPRARRGPPMTGPKLSVDYQVSPLVDWRPDEFAYVVVLGNENGRPPGCRGHRRTGVRSGLRPLDERGGHRIWREQSRRTASSIAGSPTPNVAGGGSLGSEADDAERFPLRARRYRSAPRRPERPRPGRKTLGVGPPGTGLRTFRDVLGNCVASRPRRTPTLYRSRPRRRRHRRGDRLLPQDRHRGAASPGLYTCPRKPSPPARRLRADWRLFRNVATVARLHGVTSKTAQRWLLEAGLLE